MIYTRVMYKLKIWQSMMKSRVQTRPMHRRTGANLYLLERQLTKASEPLFGLEGGAKGQI